MKHREPSLSPGALALERAIGAARREAPRAHLAEHIVAEVEYRSRLAREHASPARITPRNAWLAASGAIASAAVLLVLIRPTPPPLAVTPEPGSAPRPVTREAPARKPVSDPCVARRTAGGTSALIDDFEDGDDAILPNEGRVGLWRWARETDSPGTAPALLPIPRAAPSPANRLALRAKGGKLLDWGATIEFTFEPACYDASKYRGVAFSARGPGRVYFAPRETSVIPISEGGTCEVDCHNPHAAKIDLERSFRVYEVLWSDVRQRGLGKPALDPKRLNSLAFLVRPEDTPYDVWIDDVRFIP